MYVYTQCRKEMCYVMYIPFWFWWNIAKEGQQNDVMNIAKGVVFVVVISMMLMGRNE